MWLGSGQQLAKVDTDEVSLLASRVHVLDAARNLGVLFDSQLSMSAQVSAVCRTSYYQLRQLRPLVRCLSEDAVKTMIQAFINTRLDYCNSLYFSIADGLMSGLQSVQNAASRLITGVTRCEHITPVLCVSCTGCQSADAWNSRYPPSSIVRWLALLLCT